MFQQVVYSRELQWPRSTSTADDNLRIVIPSLIYKHGALSLAATCSVEGVVLRHRTDRLLTVWLPVPSRPVCTERHLTGGCARAEGACAWAHATD